MFVHEKKIVQAGRHRDSVEKAVVLVHGRGSSAQGILFLKDHLQLDDMLIMAPQATNRTWYPYSFMAPEVSNQPTLDSAIALLGEVVSDLEEQGFAAEQIYFVGFSQGACLVLEYVARHAQHYGGVVAFTGGLIGEQLQADRYQGDFAGTPILITSGDPDPHVPLSRIEESITILKNLGAAVNAEIYPDKPHSISADETALANSLVFG